MLSSFLNRARTGTTLCVLLAFFQGQMSWGMKAGMLIPGAPLHTPSQQAAPAQPGELQQQPAAPQAQQPTTPPAEDQTTVVQVPVPKEGSLDISVVDGEGESNVVGKKSSVKPMVEVRDEKNQPLEGAVVTFIAPADGPSVVFSNGLRTVTVMTDSAGHARTPSLHAVNAGAFRLQVSASFRGQMVSTSISQTNFDSSAEAKGKVPPVASEPGDRPVANKKGGGLSGTTLAILIGVGAAAAVGIAVGLGHKGSSTTTTTSATIGGAGTPTVGAP